MEIAPDRDFFFFTVKAKHKTRMVGHSQTQIGCLDGGLSASTDNVEKVVGILRDNVTVLLQHR